MNTVNGDSFVPEKPRVWMSKLAGAAWDLAPNGKCVVVLTPVQTPDAPPKQEHTIVMLQNFFDELRRGLLVN